MDAITPRRGSVPSQRCSGPEDRRQHTTPPRSSSPWSDVPKETPLHAGKPRGGVAAFSISLSGPGHRSPETSSEVAKTL